MTQIDRFDGDEDIWRTKLFSKEVSPQKFNDKNNLRFDLTTPSDFQLFENMVENESHPAREWKKP